MPEKSQHTSGPAKEATTFPSADLALPTAAASRAQWALAVKRTVDIVGALSFFLRLGWLYIAVWWMVLLTTGRPAIYRHTRIGKNGKEFACLKFRSMVVDGDRVLAELLASDLALRKEWEETHKLRNDPRITRFGHFIRKTSLDELPQFWNVLRGDMRLVGPRAPSCAANWTSATACMRRSTPACGPESRGFGRSAADRI
ncbi:sugar transferase [Xylophilus sp.]|uniref:sugar transferase n=1 Tax=Xylophilus sp. TaxID=2653893 RepID=UPI0013B8D248|nr:sugar transferase [Xylophilus sp.]KAF1045176.1 MAG: putative undecaprenyl-phosphate N-acetylgalactosaminyl 1-phosphate transferase [Xylophilus sp.]